MGKLMNSEFTPNTRTFKPYAGWRQGHAEHLVFVVRLDQLSSDDIIDAIAGTRKKLATSSAYIPFPQNYLHITAKALGFMGVDHTPKDRISIIKQASCLLAEHAKFEISLKGIGMFPSVVYAKVEDNGQFLKINKTLLSLKEATTMKYDSPNYIPHMALGTYKEGADIREISELAEPMKSLEFGKAQITHIDLVIARWQGTKFPVFELVERFEVSDLFNRHKD